MDEIHLSRHSRFIRIQYDRSSCLRHCCAPDRFLETVRGNCLASVGRSDLVLLLDTLPGRLSLEGLRVEIVSSA